MEESSRLENELIPSKITYSGIAVKIYYYKISDALKWLWEN
jgi:hypothetical protein